MADYPAMAQGELQMPSFQRQRERLGSSTNILKINKRDGLHNDAFSFSARKFAGRFIAYIRSGVFPSS